MLITFFALKCLSWRRQKRGISSSYEAFQPMPGLQPVPFFCGTWIPNTAVWPLLGRDTHFTMRWQWGLGGQAGWGRGEGQIDSVKLFRLSQYLIVVCVCQFGTYLLLIMLNAKYTWNQFKRSEIRLIELTKDGTNRAHRNLFSDEVNYRATDIRIWKT